LAFEKQAEFLLDVRLVDINAQLSLTSETNSSAVALA